MFGSNGSGKGGSNSTATVDTLIGRQTEVSGDVHFSGGLHVDGKIKGKVVAQSDKAASLSVAESGCIEGDVRVPHIVLNGSVVGDVHASEKVMLAAKARVTGNVYYRIIEMEGGALVNGQLVHEAADGGAGTHIHREKSAEEVRDELSEVRKAKGFTAT